ncbi:MAG: ATP-binding protein [Anaerolineales bacterium]
MAKVIGSDQKIFRGQYASLDAIREFITQKAHEAGLSSSGVYAIELAVDEACSNIIEHAYGGEGHGDILCRAIIHDDGLEVLLIDQGIPFDPAKIPQPNLSKPLKRVNSRGVGLFLMKKLVDQLEYHHSETEGNVMRLFKSK